MLPPLRQAQARRGAWRQDASRDHGCERRSGRGLGGLALGGRGRRGGGCGLGGGGSCADLRLGAVRISAAGCPGGGRQLCRAAARSGAARAAAAAAARRAWRACERAWRRRSVRERSSSSRMNCEKNCAAKWPSSGSESRCYAGGPAFRPYAARRVAHALRARRRRARLWARMVAHALRAAVCWRRLIVMFGSEMSSGLDCPHSII